jgi:hypothetical protein
MKTPEDPPRWSDGVDAPAALGSLLSAAKRDVATDAELSELDARLKPLLNAQPSAAPTATPTFLKLAGGLVALVGLGAVIALRQPREAAPSAASARPIAVAPAATGSGPGLQSPLPQASSSPPAGEVASGAPDRPPATAPQKPLVGGTPPAARASNPAQAEASLLEQARAALSASPAQALRLAQQHAQQFPHGLLAQEREVIAISALRRLGRTTEADARAARFDARYPHSLHQQAVDRPSPQ